MATNPRINKFAPPVLATPSPALSETERIILDLNKRRAQELTKHTNQMYKDIVEEHPLSRLPEHIFKNDFLPFFCGEITIEQKPDVLVRWCSVAGSAQAEVEIIDDNTHETLFKVPAFNDTTIINPKRPDRGVPGIYDIISLANSAQINAVGQNQLIRNLAVKSKQLITKSEAHVDNENRWIEIFKRYGKLKAEDKPVEAVEQTGGFSDDELRYD